MKTETKKVLVTGGAGYVGAVLVPKLIKAGFRVKVLDLFLYGVSLAKDNNLKQIKGDIRDTMLLEKELGGIDSVIHLAAISNDPSFDLDPALGKAINYTATKLLVDICVEKGVKRFIYVSTSSVYGIKKEKWVSEELTLEPLTDYSKYKALSEQYILAKSSPNFTVLVIRPATVCGYSPRLRLDLTVNMLTLQALVNKKITVFGGKQLRPNIHIEDITDLYLKTLSYPSTIISGRVYNCGYENLQVIEIARLVKKVVNDPYTSIEVIPTNDLRSYHISSEKISKELKFKPKHTVEEAITDLKEAYKEGLIERPMDNDLYYNLKLMNKLELK